MTDFTKIYQTINALSQKVNSYHSSSSEYFEDRADTNAENITETQEGLMETYDLTAENADNMADVRTALEEIYEMIIGGDENG